MAVIRLGTCSWADEGLLEHWYPRGVSSPAARLAHYAERFDVVEADSPYYRLPSSETAAKWAERTPAGFVFHVKASGEMTGALFNNNRDDFAPRSAQILRGLLDEQGIPARGAVEPALGGQLQLGT